MSETKDSQYGPGEFDYAPSTESPLPSDSGLRLARHIRRLSGVYVDHSQDEVHSVELFDTLQPYHHLKETAVKLPFPSLLYKLISEASKNNEEDIISWSYHGRCFVVHSRDAFVHIIMPR